MNVIGLSSNVHRSQQRQKSGYPIPCWPLKIKDGVSFDYGFVLALLGALSVPIFYFTVLVSIAIGSHGEHETQSFHEEKSSFGGEGQRVPGATFQIYMSTGAESYEEQMIAEDQVPSAAQTILDAFISMIQNRTQYQRFNEALTKKALQNVIVEPRIFNHEGKEFSFLVVRTKQPGKVNLLISASALKEKGYIKQPEKLIPALEREFQWIVIKSDTKPKRKMPSVKRDLKNALIKTNREIRAMSAGEREQVLQELFNTYLTTVDDYNSLANQSAYEVGSTTLMPPAQPDSSTKLYDIRVRNALQLIVRDPYFLKNMPKAVTSLLNGKIWNVAFAQIDERHWATRTRVLPKNKSVPVGKNGITIQPAKILINLNRRATPEDPYYSFVNGLPMGALSTEQLAHVIALEIHNNITDKSMRGHVAQDEMTAPR